MTLESSLAVNPDTKGIVNCDSDDLQFLNLELRKTLDKFCYCVAIIKISIPFLQQDTLNYSHFYKSLPFTWRIQGIYFTKVEPHYLRDSELPLFMPTGTKIGISLSLIDPYFQVKLAGGGEGESFWHAWSKFARKRKGFSQSNFRCLHLI